MSLLRLVGILLFTAIAIVSVVRWAKGRFWVPIYVHVLAGIGLVVGIALTSQVSSDIGWLGLAASVLVIPAWVYGAFIAYGGPLAARQLSEQIVSAASPRQIALSAFEDIRRRYPSLRMELDEAPEHVDLVMNLPQQPGLAFDIHLNLQNLDELHLCAGKGFWIEMFPCTEPSVLERYVGAVCGLIDGRWRILERRADGRYLRGYLQRPDGDGWKTVGRSFRGSAAPWVEKSESVLQNTDLAK